MLISFCSSTRLRVCSSRTSTAYGAQWSEAQGRHALPPPDPGHALCPISSSPRHNSDIPSCLQVSAFSLPLPDLRSFWSRPSPSIDRCLRFRLNQEDESGPGPRALRLAWTASVRTSNACWRTELTYILLTTVNPALVSVAMDSQGLM
jgi:hypothetical protein